MEENELVGTTLFAGATAVVQANAAGNMIAKVLGSMRENLLNEGFSSDEAFLICLMQMHAFQTTRAAEKKE